MLPPVCPVDIKLSEIKRRTGMSDQCISDNFFRLFEKVSIVFSGEERLPIQLRMGTLAHNLMLEEYPLSSNHFTQEDDKHWLLTIDVCSYAGIGRFVLGLFEDIEVLGSPEFIKYLQEKIKGYQIK